MNIDLHERLGDAFEPTPERFHHQVACALRQPGHVSKHRLRPVLVLALCAALLCGSAIALDRIGVLYFFSERLADGSTAAWMQNDGDVVVPVSQSCDSQTLDMSVRDVYLSADEIAVCVHIAPKQPEKYRLLSETDIGMDGESFERIWWEGDLLTFDEWLPEGREMLVVSGRYMQAGSQRMLMSSDWVPEEAGETFLFCAELWQLADALEVNADGTLTIRIAVDSRVYGAEGAETSVITCTIPIGKE